MEGSIMKRASMAASIDTGEGDLRGSVAHDALTM